MGLHVIVKGSGPDRVRLAGVFTDDQFFALPLVRSFGAFPSGFAALHFGDDPESVGHQHAMALPESDTSAVTELTRLERIARRARYAVEHGDDRAYFPSVSAATQHVEREIIGRWVSQRGPRGGWSHRAVKRTRYGERKNEPGTVIASWALREGRHTMGSARIRRLDARGALEYASKEVTL